MFSELLEIVMTFLPFVIVLIMALIVLFIASIPRISKWLIKTDVYLSTKNKGSK